MVCATQMPRRRSRVGEIAALAAPDTGDESPDSIAIAPALPAGLTFDVETGAIAGIPTAALRSADFTVTATKGTSVHQSVLRIGRHSGASDRRRRTRARLRGRAGPGERRRPREAGVHSRRPTLLQRTRYREHPRRRHKRHASARGIRVSSGFHRRRAWPARPGRLTRLRDERPRIRSRLDATGRWTRGT